MDTIANATLIVGLAIFGLRGVLPGEFVSILGPALTGAAAGAYVAFRIVGSLGQPSVGGAVRSNG